MIWIIVNFNQGFPGGSVVKNPPSMEETQEIQVWSLGQEDPLQEGMATHSSILAGNKKNIPQKKKKQKKNHGQRSLASNSPWHHKELDMTEVIGMQF